MSSSNYSERLKTVSQWIDEHRDAALADLQRFCRQPSVAAQNWGMSEMAAIVAGSLNALGATTTQHETPGFPVFTGHIAGENKRHLLIYDHYDVQPPDPVEQWRVPPFSAEIIDGHLYARGVADNKANLVSRLWAVRAWLATYGKLPCDVTFLVEGEEEIGSINLADFAAAHQSIIKADACLWESGGREANGRLTLNAGAKGILYVELRTRGVAYDLHSSNAPIAPNAVWHLLAALNTLRDPSGRILIEHFYDDVLPPTERERELMARNPIDIAERLQSWQISHPLGETADPATLTERLLYSPTCNICGIWGGYSGEGSKTIIPASAGVKIDFRLVPNQDPNRVLALLRQHLQTHGFADVEAVALEEGEYPAQSNVDTPLMTALIRSARAVYANEPAVLPRTAGTGPMELLCQRYGIPVVGGAGTGYYNSRIHSPNENIRVEDFFLGVKHIAALLAEFAAS